MGGRRIFMPRAKMLGGCSSMNAMIYIRGNKADYHPGGEISTRQALDRIIRREVEHTYHPACTARMGTESSGVVDPQLRVHGVRQLRVADASVFPSIPHGDTHAPTVMTGEKAAIMITAAS